MSRNLTLLKKYMKRKRKYSLKELKELLIIDLDDDLMTLIVDLLEQELEKFNFNTKVNRFSFLLRSFEYLNWQKSQLNFQNKETKEMLIDRLTELNSLINDKIKSPGSIENEKIYEQNLEILNRVVDAIKKYQEKNQVSINNPRIIEDYLYQIMHEIIFDLKVKHVDRYSRIETMISSMPLLKNISNLKGQSLIETMTNKYLELLTANRNNIDDQEVLYMEQILKLFSQNYYDEMIVLKIKNKVEKSILDINYSTLLSEEKRRLIFHIEQLLIALKISKEKQIDLNYKYKIETTIEEEDYIIEALSLAGYMDLRKKRIFTVDNPRAKRKDDALSFEKLEEGGYELGIYITDVDAFVPMNSKLDLLANKKASLVSDKKLDLFPKKLASEAMSLNQYKKCPVIAYMFYFDDYGNLKSFKIDRAIVEIERNYSYSDADRLLHKNRFNLQEMQKILVSQNEKETKNIKIQDIHCDNYSVRNIVRESAVFLNSFIANYCSLNKIPFIYRNDTIEISDKLNQLLNDKQRSCREFKMISDALKNVRVPYNLSTKPIGYRCSITGVYGSLTSPLYRLDSLANLRFVKKFMINPSDISKEEYEAYFEYADQIAELLQSKETKAEFYRKDKMIQKTLNS
jgi:hypothetical protein